MDKYGYKRFDFEDCKNLIDIYLQSGYVPIENVRRNVQAWVAYHASDRKKLLDYIDSITLNKI